MPTNDVLEEETRELETRWKVTRLGEEKGHLGLLVHSVPLPAGKYVQAETPRLEGGVGSAMTSVDVLLRISLGYPHAAPDMF